MSTSVTVKQPRDPGGTFAAVDAPRSVLLNLRVREDERERWRAAAAAEGLTLSEWVRRTLDAHSGNG